MKVRYGARELMSKVYLRPSETLLLLVDIYANRNAFATAHSLPYTTFSDWLDGRPGASLPGNLIARLIASTGMPYEKLFTHSDKRPKQLSRK